MIQTIDVDRNMSSLFFFFLTKRNQQPLDSSYTRDFWGWAENGPCPDREFIRDAPSELCHHPLFLGFLKKNFGPCPHLIGISYPRFGKIG